MATNLQPITINYIFTARRYIVIAVVVALAMIAATLFITIPIISASFTANTERIAASQKLVKLRTKVQQLSTATDPQFQANRDLVNSLLPSKKPLVETLLGVNNAVLSTQVSISSVELNPGEVAPDASQLTPDVNLSGPTQELLVYLTIEGTLEQLNQFFETVEKTTPLITITELSLSPLEGEGLFGGNLGVADQPYSAKLTLAASYFVQTVETAAEDELPEISLDQQKVVEELAAFTVIAPNIQEQVISGGLEDLFGLAQPELVVK